MLEHQGRVSPKKFVAAVAAQCHVHPLTREARQQKGGDHAVIGTGLRQVGAEQGNDVEQRPFVADQLVVSAANVSGHAARPGALVKARFAKADREGFELGRVPRSQSGDEAGVEAAG